MRAAITGVEYYLPEPVVTSETLAKEFPEWSVEKIEEKTGISQRHIAGGKQCSSDLGVAAAKRLFASGLCKAADIDFLLFCTQSPDYFLPTTACLIQDRLGIPTHAGALDFNLGCSGFVYGTALAKGLIETGQAQNVLLITGETYSKFINKHDKSVRTLFGDAGAATLIRGLEGVSEELLGPFVFGTDGRGADKLIVPTGGMRSPRSALSGSIQADASGNARCQDDLFMDGAEIFNFTLREIPTCVHRLLKVGAKSSGDIDLFIFHQANRYMLEHLRRKLAIPSNKYHIGMQYCGNTVSSSIPIALKQAAAEGRLRDDSLLAIVGFGVGYSWAAALMRSRMQTYSNAPNEVVSRGETEHLVPEGV
jgi:3-oxoacyl-[acyl-carrier-protein] synthase III